MAASVDIVINAEDLASSVFGAMGGALSGVMDLASKAVGVVGDFFSSSITAAKDQQDVSAQLEAGLKSTGGVAGVTMQQMLDLADAQAKVTSFSKVQTEGIEKLALTFTSINANILPQTIQLSEDMAQRLGIQGTQAMTMIGKAMDDPIKGMGALHRVGVSFTEQQKDQIRALVNAGDTMGAQKLLLGELSKEYGGSATAAGATFAGQQAILANQMEAVKEKIGGALLPVLGQLTGYVSAAVMPLFTRFADWFTAIVPKVSAVAGVIFEMGRAIIQGTEPLGDWSLVFEKLTPLIGKQFARAVEDAGLWLADLRDKVLAISQAAITYLEPFVTQAIQWFQVALPQALAFVNQHMDEFKGALEAVGAVLAGAAIIGAIASIAGTIAALVTPIGLVIGAAALLGAAWAGDWGGIQEKAAAAWAYLQPVLSQLVDWLQVAVPAAIQATADFWTNTLQPALAAVWSFIQTKVIPILVETYTWLKTNIPPALTALAGFWTGTLQPALNAVWSFIQNNLIPIFVTLVKDNIIIMQTAVRLLGEVWSNVLQPALAAVWAYIDKNVMPIFTALGDFLGKTFSPAIKAISDLLSDQLVKAFGSAQSSIGPVQTAIEAVGKAISDAIDWVQRFIDKLDSVHVPSILTQHSPSILEKALIDVGTAAQFAGTGIEHVNKNLGASVLRSGSAGASSAGGTSGGASAGVTHVWNIDARNATMNEGQFKKAIERVMDQSAAKSLSRFRTGN